MARYSVLACRVGDSMRYGSCSAFVGKLGFLVDASKHLGYVGIPRQPRCRDDSVEASMGCDVSDGDTERSPSRRRA